MRCDGRYLRATRASLDRMSAGANIILIGSISAVSQSAGSSIYVAAKAGVQGFAHTLRQELAEKDIKVGLIEPGFTGADFQYPEYPPDKQREAIQDETMLRAQDIAVATHFVLTRPRRTTVSLMRIESRRKHQ
jgi:3-oxoacyl-[acyl-carrier protein] reductase